MTRHDSESNQWYAHWFDSPFYHILYQHRNHEEAAAFVDTLCNHLELPAGSTALDLACGKGRHSLRLHQNGLRVHGVDLSPQSIEHASRFATDGLEFAVHDMRDVYKANHFDLVANLFTSFGYFDSTSENARVLNAVKTMLKPTGVFVLDFMNAEKVVANLQKQATCTLSDIPFEITKRVENGIIIKRIQFQADDHKYDFEERVQALTLPDFEALFAAAGFQIEAIFGDYQLGAFEASASPRLILKARVA